MCSPCLQDVGHAYKTRKSAPRLPDTAMFVAPGSWRAAEQTAVALRWARGDDSATRTYTAKAQTADRVAPIVAHSSFRAGVARTRPCCNADACSDALLHVASFLHCTTAGQPRKVRLSSIYVLMFDDCTAPGTCASRQISLASMELESYPAACSNGRAGFSQSCQRTC